MASQFDSAYRDNLYRFMVGQPYDDYLDFAAEKIVNKANNPETVLSVGCGNGDIEARLPKNWDLTLHDIHDAATRDHPELFWVPHLPNGQYDYVYAFGSVFASVPQEDKQKFIDDLASRVKDGGTLYICTGYSRQERVCRPKIYNTEGHTVSIIKTARGDDWQEITTHVWGVAKIPVTYFIGSPEDYWGQHLERINCTT